MLSGILPFRASRDESSSLPFPVSTGNFHCWAPWPLSSILTASKSITKTCFHHYFSFLWSDNPVSSSYRTLVIILSQPQASARLYSFQGFHYTYKVSLFLFCTCKTNIHKLWELGHRCLLEDHYSAFLNDELTSKVKLIPDSVVYWNSNTCLKGEVFHYAKYQLMDQIGWDWKMITDIIRNSDKNLGAKVLWYGC